MWCDQPIDFESKAEGGPNKHLQEIRGSGWRKIEGFREVAVTNLDGVGH